MQSIASANVPPEMSTLTTGEHIATVDLSRTVAALAAIEASLPEPAEADAA